MIHHRMLALFNDFDGATNLLRELKATSIPGLDFDNVTMKSPIEHPDVEAVLGLRPVNVQKWTLFGSLFGGIVSFVLISAAQGNFFAQMKGGKPIIPIPPNLVLTYEMLILGGVFITIVGFLIGAGLPVGLKSSLYNAKISEDQIGILIKAEAHAMPQIRALFEKHRALEIQEEVVA